MYLDSLLLQQDFTVPEKHTELKTDNHNKKLFKPLLKTKYNLLPFYTPLFSTTFYMLNHRGKKPANFFS